MSDPKNDIVPDPHCGICTHPNIRLAENCDIDCELPKMFTTVENDA